MALRAFLIISFLFPLFTFAQNKQIEIKGKVVEKNIGEAVPFATVLIYGQPNKKLLDGVTTNDKGVFVAKVNTEKVLLEISFIGYITKTITSSEAAGDLLDFGTIVLEPNTELLEEVEVRAEKSQTEFKLDKRVFNVGKDLSTTGASALDVLNNVPSVNVSIEGQISLRGNSGVQILINGKPSVLASEEGNALGTITAEMIESIEVITNPSAKYEAEGTSGIINILLKKEERRGLNGSVSLNTGIPDNHSLGLSLNRRTEKFNLFSQLGVGYRSLPEKGNNINEDLLSGNIVKSNGKEYRNENFYNLRLGTDYYINPRNVITLSGNFAYEIEDQPSNFTFEQFLKSSPENVSVWERTEETDAKNPKWQYELQYKLDFKDDKDHVLIFSALGDQFSKDQHSSFTNKYITADGEDNFQRTATDFGEVKYTFKLDYTQPFKNKITLEAGSQYLLQDVNNDYSVSNLENDVWVTDESLTNLFEYKQNVLGVYSTGSYEGKLWGLKLGLRLENTDLSTLLANTNQENAQNYTNLFPSVHTSFKMSKLFSLQAGYSRRIFRPRMWDLNPFFNIRNNFNVYTGNPNLQPEFSDSYELNAIYDLEKISMNFGLFHLFTTDVVERISTFENNVNTSKPLNIGTRRSTGMEFNGKYTPSKWLVLNANFNYNYFTREGTYEVSSFDFSSDNWSANLNSKFQFPHDIDFEITGFYNSSVKTVQSTISDNVYVDLGLRKKFLKGRAVLNLSVRDVFTSRFREVVTSQSNFYTYGYERRGRFFALGLSFGFGKGEAMEYLGGRR